MREDHPILGPDNGEPTFVGGIRREVVGMALDTKAGRPQDVRKTGSQVAVGEEDTAQAVRSYTNASSTSDWLSP